MALAKMFTDWVLVLISLRKITIGAALAAYETLKKLDALEKWIAVA
jgi:hypothetical protein